MAVSAIRDLAAKESVWVLANRLVAPIWRRLHDPNKVMVVETSLSGTWQLVFQLRNMKFQRCYILPGATRGALLTFAAGIPKRSGYDEDLKRYFLTDIPELPAAGTLHKSLDYYALLHGLSALEGKAEQEQHENEDNEENEEKEQKTTEDLGGQLTAQRPLERVRLRSRLERSFNGQQHPAEPRPYVISIIPGAARGPAKRWPIEHFVALTSALLNGSAHSRIEILGAPGDKPLGEAITAGLHAHPHRARVVDRTGKTAIDQWLDAIATSAMVICNDSGGMHVADGFGRPLIAMFGTTDPSKTGPASISSVAIQKSHFASEKVARDSKQSQQALAEITPEEVYRQCQKMLPWLQQA